GVRTERRQYFLGRELLVAPVLLKGATEVDVYLPPGGWYDFWSGNRFEGPTLVSAPAPIDLIPVFVREASILPMGPPTTRNSAEANDELVICVFPGTRGSLWEASFQLQDGTILQARED